jgi:hypothetical protein
VFENLTIENSFRGRKKGKGAALSFVNDATRAVLSNVTVLGYGGDTLVLAARRWRLGDGGEYYLKDVAISGTYHEIVPRGATYATHCRFWCMGGVKNCLFNEGITRESDRLVIRDSIIDGPEPFGLGSYFRDAAWYFIDDHISDKLRPDGSIFRDPAKGYTMKWGEGRTYFAGNQAPQYPWLQDNVQFSPAKSKETITAAWTFSDWDPESERGPRIMAIERQADEITVRFSESVTVEGEPLLELQSGKNAQYERGSGTSTLVFREKEQSIPKRLILNGGFIFASGASLHQRDANLSLPK